MTLEDRLRTTLRETADTIAVDSDHQTVVAAPARRRWSPLVAFAVGVAAVGLLGVGVWLAPGGAPEGPPPLETAESMNFEWTRLDLLPADFMAGPFAVGPEGILTRGSRFRGVVGDNTQLVYQSPDGVTWSKLDARGFGGQRLAASADGYVSYGRFEGNRTTVTTSGPPTRFPRPAVWISQDGVEWDVTFLPLPSLDEAISDIVSYQLFDLAVAGSEMMAVGTEFDEDLPEMEGSGSQFVPSRQIVWATDSDGSWELVDFPMEHPVSVAAGPEGIILIEATAEGAAIWAREGESWSQTASIDSDVGFGLNAVGNATGYAIAGDGVWFSPDGSDWARVDGPVNAGTVEAGPSSFVALGSLNGQHAVWWSGTGTEWTLAGTDDDFGLEEDAFISYVGVTDHAIIIAGQEGRGIKSPFSGEIEGYIAIGSLES